MFGSNSFKKSVMIILLTILYQLRVPALFSPYKSLLLIINLLTTLVTCFSLYLFIQYLKSGPPVNKTIIHFLAINLCKLCFLYDLYDFLFCLLVVLFQTQLTLLYETNFSSICAILPSNMGPIIYAYTLAIVSFQE